MQIFFLQAIYPGQADISIEISNSEQSWSQHNRKLLLRGSHYSLLLISESQLSACYTLDSSIIIEMRGLSVGFVPAVLPELNLLVDRI
jgi:hypothetical protein